MSHTPQQMAKNVEEYIIRLAERGEHVFSTEDALRDVTTSPAVVRDQIRRSRSKRVIVTPLKSLHLIIPPEYRRLGCLPAEHFADALMARLGQPYYVGLLSAAERHGAAHQRPQAFQVMTTRNHRSVKCGGVRIEFIRKSGLERVPTVTLNVPTGQVRYSTPEATALDLVGYPDHAGGLDNVATVLRELAVSLDPEKLLQAAAISPLAWAQRLGYILDRLGEVDRTAQLADFVAVRAKSAALLRRAQKGAPSTRSAKWNLLVNADVEPDE
jgi:predicted transcriptional regulator of viral defense system